MVNRIYKITVTAVGVFLIMLVVAAFALDLKADSSIFSDEALDGSTGWMDAAGDPARLFGIDLPAGSAVSFQRIVDSKDSEEKSLCFFSHNIVFKVFLNDQMIYDFQPLTGGYYGKYYGDYIHTVALPSFSGEAKLRIEGKILTGGNWTGFDQMVFQKSGAFILSIAQKNAVHFLIGVLIFCFGAILFVFGIIENLLHADMLETICLGVVTMLLSLWVNTPTKILHLFTGNPSALRVIDYAVLCLLPIPILIFVASFTKNQKNILLSVCIILCGLNFLCQAICVPLGLFDYADMLRCTHILILFGILLIAYLIVKAICQNKIDRSQRIYIISALSIICCAGLLDMVRYYSGNSTDASFVTRIGLMFFVGILAVYELNQLILVRLKSRETEMMERLAMEDVLTGLKNRTAFVACEKSLLKRNSGKCIFLHFDVNFLKKVNDTYGHAEGDRHIVAAASVIRESFGAHGQCFRVGGDEFFVILDDENGWRKAYEEGLDKFFKLQEKYNREQTPPVRLSIAHGMAEYAFESHNPEEAERLADSRMYENKSRMKTQWEQDEAAW